MEKKLKIGIIGCGAVAEACHLQAAKNISDIKVKALVDVKEEQAEDLAEKFNLKEALIYTDYLGMLRDSDIDAVWILTPPKLHAKMVIDSLNYGKHVLCEKPLATSVKEAEQITETLGKISETPHRQILMPAHNFIFTPCFDRALHLVRAGKLGRIKRIISHTSSNLSFYKAKTDFRTQAKGGVIEDQLPHVVYLSQYIAGPCTEIVSVRPRIKGHTIAQDVIVDAKLQGGIDAELSASWSQSLPTLKFDIFGETGQITMDLLRRPYNLTILKGGKKETIRMGRQLLQYWDVLRGNHPSYLNEHKHFLEVINGVAEPRVTIADGFNLVKTLETILRTLDERPSSYINEEIISLVRVEDDVETAVRKAVSLLGGLKIKKGDKVIIKPNICFPKNIENMVITDPKVLSAVLGLVKEKTDNVFVVESNNSSGSGDERVEKAGIMDVIEEYGATFLNLSEDKYEEHEVSDLSIKIPKTVLEADYLINVPKMKTCNIANTFISIAMKNMFGILADKKKTRLHKNIANVLLYINKTLPQDIIIVDGIVAMEGLGPVWGTPVHMGLIVSGLNSVTVDAVCCNIMGINPYAVQVLWSAYKSGMGEIDINKIKILGEDILDVRRKFAYPVFLVKNIRGTLRTALKNYIK